MKKQWRLLALLLTFVVLVGGYLFLKSHPKKTNSSDSKPAAVTEQILKLDKDKITKIAFNSSNGQFNLVKKDKTWTIDGSTAKLVQSLADGVATNLGTLQANGVVESNPSDLDKYGLKTPAATVTITSDSGDKTIYLGNKTPLGDSYYVNVKDVNKVYTIATANEEYLVYSANQLKDKTLTIKIDATSLSYISVTPSTGRPIEIQTNANQQSSQSQGAAAINLTKPYSKPIEVDSMSQDGIYSQMLAALPTIAVTDVVEDNAQDLSKYGLDKPVLDIVAKDKTNTLHLLIGKDKDDSYAYFKLADSKIVYTIDKSLIKCFYNIDPFKLISRFVYLPFLDDLDSFEIKTKDKTYTEAFTRTTKKAEKSGDKDTVTTTYKVNNKDVKEDAYKTYYQTLLTSFYVDAENDKNITDNAEITMTFNLNKGDKKQQKVDFSSYNDDFYAVFIDGKAEFLVSKTKVQKALDATENIMK